MPIAKPPFSLRGILKSLIVLEDFVTIDECRRMVEIHQQCCREPDVVSNNTVWTVEAGRRSSADDEFMKSIIQRIGDVLLHETSDGDKQSVDFASLTARRTGNRCVLHADNARYACDDDPEMTAETLRAKIRTGEIAGLPPGDFVPNHTPNREYTALLYLDNDHVGGDLWFQDSILGDTYRLKIATKAGVLCIHPNGPAFFHETDTVTQGTRYSLNVWYSSDVPPANRQLYSLGDVAQTES